MGEEETDDLNETLYSNLYEPKLIPGYQEEEDPVEKAHTPKLQSRNIGTTRLGWKRRVDYSLAALQENKAKLIATEHDFFRDPNRMLEATITAIVLLASNQDAPKENLIYADLYLKNIRDDYGNHPKNIEKFLKYLITKKQDADIQNFKEYKTRIPENITVTKLVQNSTCVRSRIPVSIRKCRPPV